MARWQNASTFFNSKHQQQGDVFVLTNVLAFCQHVIFQDVQFDAANQAGRISPVQTTLILTVTTVISMIMIKLRLYYRQG